MSADRRPDASGEARFFFVHVMKTGGSTVRAHVAENFPDCARYPDPTIEGTLDPSQSRLLNLSEAGRNIRYVTSLPDERLRSIRVFCGHFPFVVSRMLGDRLGEQLVTLTMLRDPVERVVSHLKHAKRYIPQWEDASFEEIFEDAYLHAFFFSNYQTRLFAFTEADDPETQFDQIDMDAGRLELAKAHLDRVDHVGLRENHGDLLERMNRMHGWPLPTVADRRVSTEDWAVSDPLRRRIEDANELDLEFYDHARKLWAAQQE